MSKEEKDILSKINDKLDHLTESVETIRRGVYGDKDNNVLGLIQRQEIDEKERSIMKETITGIKNQTWKLSLLIGGVGSGIVLIIKYLIL